MDNLVLTRLALDLAGDLSAGVLGEFRQQSGERFRLSFETPSGSHSLAVSLVPELPWIGRPAFRWEGPVWSPDPFAVTASRALTGRVVVSVAKDPADRSLRFDFGEGRGLVVELATHGANLILLGIGGDVEAALRHPKRSSDRLAPGRPWSARGLPPGRLDPLNVPAARLDAAIAERVKAGESMVEAIRHVLFGVGPAEADLILREAARSDRSAGEVLRERVDALLRAESEIAIEGPEDPLRAAHAGTFRPEQFRLLAWRPAAGLVGTTYTASGSSATVGLFHEAVELVGRTNARLGALRSIVRGELRRVGEAESKVAEGLRSFADPERHARLGEALLAGLAAVRRAADVAFVPDPYDPSATEIPVPAPSGKPLTEVADDLFRRSRRARRGLALAGVRAQKLAERGRRLEALLSLGERAVGVAGVAELEEAMRAERLAVGLAGPSRAARAAAQLAPPRLDGIRMLGSVDGWTILVGRTGRDNDRLTFKIAAPDDVWLHAAGVPGAHVVIKNPERKSAVPETTLGEAARIAAWFSDARTEGAVEVQWTRRKNVRRAKGGSPGRVILKRFQSVRVRPTPPADAD